MLFHTPARTVSRALLLVLCLAGIGASPWIKAAVPDAVQGNDLTLSPQDSIVKDLQYQLTKAQTQIHSLGSRLQQLEDQAKIHAQRVVQIDTSVARLKNEAQNLSVRTDTIATELDTKSQQLTGSITDLDQRSGQHWLFTLGLIVLVLGLLAFTYWGLRKGFGKRVGAVDAELGRINEEMQAKMMKLDTDLLGSLEKLVQTRAAPQTQAAAAEVDHSLALKVADEITRIEQNLTQMDSTVKGHKQLNAAVKRMHENLQAAGYQIAELLGKPFDEGMKVTAAFIPDDTLKEDERVITRVFKPTVLFGGRMIQAGDVQVSQG